MNKLIKKIYQYFDKRINTTWREHSLGDIAYPRDYNIPIDDTFVLFPKEENLDYTFILSVESILDIDYRDDYAIELRFYHIEHTDKWSHEDYVFTIYIPKFSVYSKAQAMNVALKTYTKQYDLILNKWKQLYIEGDL